MFSEDSRNLFRYFLFNFQSQVGGIFRSWCQGVCFNFVPFESILQLISKWCFANFVSHAQKHFIKLKRQGRENLIPPRRNKDRREDENIRFGHGRVSSKTGFRKRNSFDDEVCTNCIYFIYPDAGLKRKFSSGGEIWRRLTGKQETNV